MIHQREFIGFIIRRAYLLLFLLSSLFFYDQLDAIKTAKGIRWSRENP